jgi:hypothetical protein
MHSRTKLDPNRPIDEAAQNDPYAMAAWTAFHGYIELSKEVIGRGILFDVHKQVEFTFDSLHTNMSSSAGFNDSQTASALTLGSCSHSRT